MTEYVDKDAVIPFDTVIEGAREDLDQTRPLIIIGYDKDGNVFTAATHDNQEATEAFRASSTFFD